MITDLPSLCVENIEISLLSSHFWISLLHNSLSGPTYNLDSLRLDSFVVLIKAFRTVSPFFIFQLLTHAYLVKTSMTHNKYLTFLFLEENDYISVKSGAQILSLNLA